MNVVVVCSASGSPGASVTALGLALTWPRDVLLVDADRTPSQSILAGYLRGDVAQGRGLPGLCRLYQKNTPLFSSSPIRSPIISTLYGVMMKVLVATRLIWPLLA